MLKNLGMRKIAVIGACGQIGTELVLALRVKHGAENVLATDIRENCPEILNNGPYLHMDVLDRHTVEGLFKSGEYDQVYLLAAMLSATAEKKPHFAWKLNMESLFTILDLAKDGYIKKIFWPSSIAVFGPNSAKIDTPQHSVLEPTTVYGISKLAGEKWCLYYNQQFGVDVRSIRYPGLISYKSAPGGGTTDYAIEIFHSAKRNEPFISFLDQNQTLPMMYMDDAIRATLELMDAPSDKIKVRTSYNLRGCSFSPKEITTEIQNIIPSFKTIYKPDFRQKIASSWPNSIDDSYAKNDWNWENKIDLKHIVKTMLENV